MNLAISALPPEKKRILREQFGVTTGTAKPHSFSSVLRAVREGDINSLKEMPTSIINRYKTSIIDSAENSAILKELREGLGFTKTDVKLDYIDELIYRNPPDLRNMLEELKNGYGVTADKVCFLQTHRIVNEIWNCPELEYGEYL